MVGMWRALRAGYVLWSLSVAGTSTRLRPRSWSGTSSWAVSRSRSGARSETMSEVGGRSWAKSKTGIV